MRTPPPGGVGATAARVAGGDRLAALYEVHAPAARRLAIVLTGDEHAADDLVQDPFVRVWRRLLGLRRPDQFRAYLYRTLVNLARDHARARRRETPSEVASERAARPDDLDTRAALWHALLQLPPRQPAVLFLRYYEDLSEAQAATVLDCSPAAIKSLTFRGVATLRSALEGDRP
ncbi:MAG TPA: sigma-70 family RNA polymerase sigma factor [Actinomycetota bacterium]|nr:sigma-70 family RNA polymerase sigma factor [Actinomycetota bacterium]